MTDIVPVTCMNASAGKHELLEIVLNLGPIPRLSAPFRKLKMRVTHVNAIAPFTAGQTLQIPVPVICSQTQMKRLSRWMWIEGNAYLPTRPK